jgi:hypothetical protein
MDEGQNFKDGFCSLKGGYAIVVLRCDFHDVEPDNPFAARFRQQRENLNGR